jgi:RNA polymerase sigma factor (TIGR02999 family)
MSDVSRFIEGQADDGKAAADLLPLVYAELRRLAAAQMARESPGHTLEATALVHEAWLRLGAETFGSKSHFRRAAAEAMRRILVDHARAKKAEKRGGGRRFDLSDGDRLIVPDPDTVLAIDEALTALAADDPAAAELARLRLFAGLSIEEAGESLGLSRATAFRDWAYARAFLTAALAGENNSPNS